MCESFGTIKDRPIKLRGDKAKVSIPLPTKYSFKSFKFMVLCLETSIRPQIIQNGINCK